MSMTCTRSARSNIPGAGRKRAKSTPKGRQVDPTAAHEIELLLGDRPRRRDLLIEHLHLIQDKYHQISAAHLAALADEMKLSFAEVFETATFYAHFDVVKEGEPDIAPLTIRVCDSLTCAMMGAEKLLHELQDKAGPGIRVVRAPCVGFCDSAPVAEVGHRYVLNATSAEVLDTAATRRDPSDHAILCRLRGLCQPRAATSCLATCVRGGSARKTFSRFWTTPACAGSAAQAFPPAANGGPCSASPVRG